MEEKKILFAMWRYIALENIFLQLGQIRQMAAVTGGVDLPDDSSKSEKVPHGKWESTALKRQTMTDLPTMSARVN